MAEREMKPSWREWSRANGVQASHVSEFMNGKRGPSRDLLSALGLEYCIARKRALHDAA